MTGSGLAAAFLLLSVGCAAPFRPDQAVDPYPRDVVRSKTVDVQVFREGTRAVIVNATTRSYRDVELWLNQRFMHRLSHLNAGETIRVSLWDFIDENGETFEAGGFLSTEQPMTIWLAEIRETAEAPLIGLVTIATTRSRQR